MNKIAKTTKGRKTAAAAGFLSRLMPPDARVFLASYANDRGEKGKFPPREEVITNLDDVAEFIADNDVQGRASYFAVAPVKGRRRGKDHVACVPSVFVDLDFKGIAESRKTIETQLAKLTFKPTVTVFSGHGLHCYWKLDKPLAPEQAPSTEQIMRRICAALAGDTSACEVARVLRLPGSHNSKNGEWIEVQVVDKLSTWKSYSVAELDQYFSKLDPMLTYKPTKRDEAKASNVIPFRNHFLTFAREAREFSGGFDASEWLDDMVFHDVQGHGIDDTMTHVIGAMVAADHTVQECITVFLTPMKQVYERDRGSDDPPWNERLARREIASKFKYFTRRDAKNDDEPPETAQSTPPAKNKMAAKGDSTVKKSKHEFDEIDPDAKAKPKVDPFDPFIDVLVPDLPRGALPELIESVAFAEGARMGGDPGVLAMSMLTMCASVIPDQLRLKVKRAVTDNWYQSARIWFMIVGSASSKKSPLMDKGVAPVLGIDTRLRHEFEIADMEYDAHKKQAKEKKASAPTKDGKKSAAVEQPDNSEVEKPIEVRALLSDVTSEKAATVMLQNPQGLAVVYDELVGFFGGLDRYGNRSGGAGRSARSMWLGVYNGVALPIDREGRKSPIGTNMSACVLGGIQPDVIGSLVDEGSKNDGLVQRFNVIHAKRGNRGLDKDIDPDQTIERYEDLIENLHGKMPLAHGHGFHFSAKAHEAKDRAFDWLAAQMIIAEEQDPQLAAHLGKWENMFIRFCLLFHVIDNWSDKQGRPISPDTVKRVNRLMRDYLIPQAKAFYATLSSDEELSQIKRACKQILINRKSTITARELMRSLGRNKKVTTKDMENIGSKLETWDWLKRIVGKRGRSDSLQWTVNVEVFTKLAKYVPAFDAEREANKKIMEAVFKAEKEAKEKEESEN